MKNDKIKKADERKREKKKRFEFASAVGQAESSMSRKERSLRANGRLSFIPWLYFSSSIGRNCLRVKVVKIKSKKKNCTK